MSGFHDVRLVLPVSIGAAGGPERMTDVLQLASGREQAAARRAAAPAALRAEAASRAARPVHGLKAVAAARAALTGPWGAMTVAERVERLHAVADGINRRFDEFLFFH